MSDVLLDAVQQNVVCVSNFCVRRVEIGSLEAKHFFDPSPYDRIMLVTSGSIKGCDLKHNVYTEFDAPHMIILEKDTEYAIIPTTDHVMLYELSALRHETGDIVDPENLIRENYPFDTTRSFEDQVNVN